ncbi:hypothetical protein EUTSA_v10012241mg, partial [Eutrema salsugineum]
SLPPDPPFISVNSSDSLVLTVLDASSVDSPSSSERVIQSSNDSPSPDATLPVKPLSAVTNSSFVPASIPLANAPSYAMRFQASLRNMRKISSPSFQEDGTPVIQAPPSILLQTADLWKGHIVAQFHGIIPPTAKIYAELNPVWGKFGNITIRPTSDRSCLMFIPSEQTRQWVLEVGYWQAGFCSFSVHPWSADGSLELCELQTAPTWAVLKSLPPQLYSLDGISLISSAVGEPLHTEKSRLDPYRFGDTKVKIEISLDSSPPDVVALQERSGFTSDALRLGRPLLLGRRFPSALPEPKTDRPASAVMRPPSSHRLQNR